MNTRILTSVLTIITVVAAVAGATYAFFSDSGTSSGNVFTSGTLELKLSDGNEADQDNVTATWGDTTLNPGDTGSGTLAITNAGSIAGFIDISGVTIANTENGCNASESSVDSSCGTPGAGDGELGANLLIHAFWDIDGDGVYESGDGDTSIYGTDTVFATLDGFGAASVDDEALGAGATKRISINWALPGATGNIVQSDSASLTVPVSLEQTAD